MAEKLRYVAIGDSLTAGYGAKPDETFVHHFCCAIQEKMREQPEVVNAGVVGATTPEMIRLIEENLLLRKQIRSANLISLTAGGNDLLLAAKAYLFEGNAISLKHALKQFQINYDRLIRSVRDLKESAENADVSYTLLLIGLYNPIPELEESAFWVQAFNKQMEKHANGHIRFINLYDRFSGREEEFLYEDRIHPNAHGYRVIASSLEQCGLPL